MKEQKPEDPKPIDPETPEQKPVSDEFVAISENLGKFENEMDALLKAFGPIFAKPNPKKKDEPMEAEVMEDEGKKDEK